MHTETAVTYEKLTGAVGAVVSGVNLAEPQPDVVIDELNRTVAEHGVLFFVDQVDLSPASQRDFAARFGDLFVHPWMRGLPEVPEIMVLAPETLPTGGGEPVRWHADATFEERPPRGSILRAVELPPVGGDTLWASMVAAYEALSSHMQRFLDGLSATHVSDSFQKLMAQGKAVDGASTAMRSHVHPVVATHAVTGKKALFVNAIFTTAIVELNDVESEKVLTFLLDHLKGTEFQVRWRWQPDAVAFWDNRATQHHVTGDYSERRVMHRATVIGDRPT